MKKTEKKEGYTLKVNEKNIILIPALDPPDSMADNVGQLYRAGFRRIVVVDDGSSEKYKGVFSVLSEKFGCHIITHGKNRGKGRSLKDGFGFVTEKYGADAGSFGVITCDCDGQHTVQDIIMLSCALDRARTPSLILGCRDFDLPGIPPRSRIGNRLTCRVFSCLYGKYIRDTQTGLRAIDRELLEEYAEIAGEGFEYEMNMLIHAQLHSHAVVEVPISTVYTDGNRSSHFRAFADSVRIYKCILGGFFRFSVSSIVSMAADQTLACTLYYLCGAGAFASKIAARVLSGTLNYMLNRRFVFSSSHNTISVRRYALLALCQMLLSSSAVWALTEVCDGTGMFFAFSAIVDALLFLFSYRAQRSWVFGG